ncbi:MAG: PQQ-dependent sugar dehydrogenase, partial [Hymenobacteraceae bacterium]|nr:PQQ-dependent sugar dehydrogenase [Hymenobacteraceae bacterium]MDX5395074.1 PQQ-dependent sugar dehydrogenase [Hymenobacteraceae bacterium]MDX5511110.1 PQQ-dependent sugar dehydrogenase [Hymenobacteraceae bacterium]
QTTSEGGLLGMALHPDFANNPYVYTVYTYSSGSTILEKVVRCTYNGSSLGSPFILLDNIIGANVHDGSRLLILPDNTLLVSTGDAANSSTSQNQNSLNGKILRMNLDGTIPANNPTPGSYVYSYGHRNPQGLTRSPGGAIYSSEHGASTDDEVNIIQPNRNYGWPTVEGLCNTPAEQTFCNTNNVAEPIATWTPTVAPAGIIYYNNPAIPEWQNSVLLTTLKASKLVHLQLNAAGTAVTAQTDYLTSRYGRLRAICQAPDGRIFISTSNRDGRTTPRATDDRIIVLRSRNISGVKEKLRGALQVYPNPAKQVVQVQFSNQQKPLQLELFDLAGRQVKLQPVEQRKESVYFSVKDLLPGIYVLRAQEQENVYYQRLVVQPE